MHSLKQISDCVSIEDSDLILSKGSTTRLGADMLPPPYVSSGEESLDENDSIDSQTSQSKRERNDAKVSSLKQADKVDKFSSLEGKRTSSVEKDDEYVTTDKGNRIREKPSACIFVASLPSIRTDTQLSNMVHEHFSKWGEIAVKVLRDNAQRPYAFVQFTNDETAKKARTEAQHTLIDGRAIRCEPANVNRTIYIKSVGEDITRQEIIDTITQYGELEQLLASNERLDQINPNPKGYDMAPAWFCKFSYRSDAMDAYTSLRSTCTTWLIEWVKNVENAADSKTVDRCSIFVGHLDPKVTKEGLTERFSQHGKVTQCVIVQKPNKTFAFVRFEKESSAAAAVERENHSMFMKETLHVQYREIHHKTNKTHTKFSNKPVPVLCSPPANLPQKIANVASITRGFPNARQAPYDNSSLPLNHSSVFSNSPAHLVPAASFGYNNFGSGYDRGYQPSAAYESKSPFVNKPQHQENVTHDRALLNEATGKESVSTPKKTTTETGSLNTSPSSKSAFSHPAMPKTLYSPTTAASNTKTSQDGDYSNSKKAPIPQSSVGYNNNPFMAAPMPPSSQNPYLYSFGTQGMQPNLGYNPSVPPRSSSYYNLNPYTFFYESYAYPPPSTAINPNPYLFYPPVPDTAKFNIPPTTMFTAPVSSAGGAPMQNSNIGGQGMFNLTNNQGRKANNDMNLQY